MHFVPFACNKLAAILPEACQFMCVTVWGWSQMDAEPIAINDDCMAPPLRSVLASRLATHTVRMIRAERHIAPKSLAILT